MYSQPISENKESLSLIKRQDDLFNKTSPVDNFTSSEQFPELKDITLPVKNALSAENAQFMHSAVIAQENALAKEIREMYCKLTHLRRIALVSMAQSNDLMSAS